MSFARFHQVEKPKNRFVVEAGVTIDMPEGVSEGDAIRLLKEVQTTLANLAESLAQQAQEQANKLKR